MVLDLIRKERFHFLVVVLVKMFGVDMSSSVYANNKTKNILILGEGIRKELDDTTLTA